jgi:hypothetical protein
MLTREFGGKENKKHYRIFANFWDRFYLKKLQHLHNSINPRIK